MKKLTTLLFLVFGFLFVLPVMPVHAEDDLDKEIQAIETQLQDIANKTGKYAKMSAEKLEKESEKLGKELDKLIDKWEKKYGKKYKRKFTSAMKDVEKDIKKAAKKTVKKIDKALDN